LLVYLKDKSVASAAAQLVHLVRAIHQKTK
jgi:hypothetical protein